MRALITGAGGFVGGHLAEHLLALGDEVAGLSLSGRWRAGVSFSNAQVPLSALDLTSETATDSLARWLEDWRPDAIYHLAAQSNPRESLDDPRGAWKRNLGGTLNLLEAVRQLSDARERPKILLASSGVCYGDPAPEHVPVSESCPLRPNNAYSSSKAAADLLGVQYALGYGLRITIARPFNHAGPRQEPRYALSGFAKQVAEAETGRLSRIETGDLNVVRDFTDVRDVARAYRLLIERGRDGEIYNLGSGSGTKLADALEALRGMASGPIAVRVDPSRIRAVDQPYLVCDAAKLRTATGWAPSYSIEQTLANLLDYWRERIASL